MPESDKLGKYFNHLFLNKDTLSQKSVNTIPNIQCWNDKNIQLIEN